MLRVPPADVPGTRVGAHPVRENTLLRGRMIRAQGALVREPGLCKVPCGTLSS